MERAIRWAAVAAGCALALSFVQPQHIRDVLKARLDSNIGLLRRACGLNHL
jgi:hypothetical protein